MFSSNIEFKNFNIKKNNSKIKKILSGLLNNYSKKDDFQRDVMNEKLSTEKIEQIISLRQSAKEQKNFELADKFREDLAQHGVSLEDGPDGTTWKFQRIKTKK